MTCYPGNVGINSRMAGPMLGWVPQLPVTAMQQIADWLKNLGMAEYAERFAENRIDFSVLPDLTDHDLEKLGVLLGDRRKMLRAIRELAGDTAVTSHAPAVAEARLQDAAERR